MADPGSIESAFDSSDGAESGKQLDLLSRQCPGSSNSVRGNGAGNEVLTTPCIRSSSSNSNSNSSNSSNSNSNINSNSSNSNSRDFAASIQQQNGCAHDSGCSQQHQHTQQDYQNHQQQQQQQQQQLLQQKQHQHQQGHSLNEQQLPPLVTIWRKRTEDKETQNSALLGSPTVCPCGRSRSLLGTPVDSPTGSETRARRLALFGAPVGNPRDTEARSSLLAASALVASPGAPDRSLRRGGMLDVPGDGLLGTPGGSPRDLVSKFRRDVRLGGHSPGNAEDSGNPGSSSRDAGEGQDLPSSPGCKSSWYTRSTPSPPSKAGGGLVARALRSLSGGRQGHGLGWASGLGCGQQGSGGTRRVSSVGREAGDKLIASINAEGLRSSAKPLCKAGGQEESAKGTPGASSQEERSRHHASPSEAQGGKLVRGVNGFNRNNGVSPQLEKEAFAGARILRKKKSLSAERIGDVRLLRGMPEPLDLGNLKVNRCHTVACRVRESSSSAPTETEASRKEQVEVLSAVRSQLSTDERIRLWTLEHKLKTQSQQHPQKYNLKGPLLSPLANAPGAAALLSPLTQNLTVGAGCTSGALNSLSSGNQERPLLSLAEQKPLQVSATTAAGNCVGRPADQLPGETYSDLSSEEGDALAELAAKRSNAQRHPRRNLSDVELQKMIDNIEAKIEKLRHRKVHYQNKLERLQERKEKIAGPIQQWLQPPASAI